MRRTSKNPADGSTPADSEPQAPFRLVLRILGSVKLFFALASGLVAVAVAVSVLPGLSTEIFASPLFLALGVLLEVNLLACTVPRFVRRVGHASFMKFAPDAIHAGLALLIAAGMVTFALREEGSVTLRIGQRAEFRGTEVELVSADEQVNPDGVLLGWRAELRESGSANGTHVVAMNAPARIDGNRFYLQDYAAAGRIRLVDETGEEYSLETGQGFIGGDGRAYYLSAVEVPQPSEPAAEPTAVFTVAPSAEADPAESGFPRRVSAGDQVDAYTYRGGRRMVNVTLSASYNPGRVPTIVALLVLGLGMGMYLFHVWRKHG